MCSHNTPGWCPANLHKKHLTFKAFSCCHTTHLADVMPTYTQNILHTTHFSVFTQHPCRCPVNLHIIVHTLYIQDMSKWSHNKPGHTQLTLQARLINVVTQPVNLQQFPLHTRLINVAAQPTAIPFTYQTHQCNHTTYSNSLYMPDTSM